ncbi:uncharacterized protein ARMOST_12837 [Armillaria ostoyae]|uniref:Uncharacterized protein n=1 Tax=Armillaria ostoyae TaxID=47428 RepID=A0A284RL38_ARMOS|nr:uncharacterized protein ARMOST_12837 [Armillaria ostoyae]
MKTALSTRLHSSELLSRLRLRLDSNGIKEQKIVFVHTIGHPLTRQTAFVRIQSSTIGHDSWKGAIWSEWWRVAGAGQKKAETLNFIP